MDLSIVSWVATHLHTPFLDAIMPPITYLGYAVWVAVCIFLLARKDTRHTGIVCAVALLLMLISVELVLKPLIARPRPFTLLPELVLLIPPSTSFSFPSGHTTSGFAAAFAILFSYKRAGRWAIALALLIAFSRLYLSVHYPTDLLGGMLLGVLCAYAARHICRRLTI